MCISVMTSTGDDDLINQEEKGDLEYRRSQLRRLQDEVQEQILKLEKQIQKTENAMWKEQQPKKKFELHTRLREYQAKLEDLKHGKS